ncbi:WD40 repeat domain-containing protein [Nocardia asteroides]|uniref:WD40 repeat domain-containing protein n=1 Tax=Nocardia asteroides TaxID=1824 RepID=UPI0037C8F77D
MTSAATDRADELLLNQLTGADQGWLRVCRAAVADGPEATRALLAARPETTVLARSSLARWKGQRDEEDLLAEEAEYPDAEGLRATADFSAAIAFAELAGALTGSRPADTAAATFLDHAERAGLSSVGTQLLPAGTPLTSESGHLGALVLHLLGRGDRTARGFAILAASELAGQRPPTLRTAETNVLFVDAYGSGRVGLLRLIEVAGGPSGLHPDPARMGFLQADSAFTASLADAWQVSTLATTGACVLWSVTTELGAPANDINGESLGAAIAVALDDLAPRLRWARRLRPRRLDPACAVTAGLNDHTLTKVGGYAGKLKAADQHSLRVVVAAAGVTDATSAAPPRLLDRIDSADTVEEAITRTRTRPNLALWSSIAAIVAVLVLMTGGLTAVVQQRIENSVVRAELSSRLYANTARQHMVTDPALAQQLALAAYRTRPTAEARAALIDSSAANAPLRVTTRFGSDRKLDFITDAPRLATTHHGDLIAIGEVDGTIELAGVTDAGLTRWPRFDTGSGAVTGLALSNDQRLLAVAGATRTTIWNIADRGSPRHAATLDLSGGRSWSAAFSPDGRYVAVSGQQMPDPADLTAQSHATLAVWDLAAGLQQPMQVLHRAFAGATQISVTLTNQLLAAAVPTFSMNTFHWSSELIAWRTMDFPSGEPFHTELISGGEDREARSAEFSADGSTLTVGMNPGHVLRWDFTNQAAPTPLPGLTDVENQYFDVASSPDGADVVVVGGDSTVRLLDVHERETAATFPAEWVVRARFLRSGRSVVTSSIDHGIHVFEVSGAPLRTGTLTLFRLPQDRIDAPASTQPDALFPALRTIARRPVDPFADSRHGDPPGLLGRVAISPDGRRAVEINERDLVVWDITDPRAPRRLGELDATDVDQDGVVFTPEGTLAVQHWLQQSVTFWDVSGPPVRVARASVGVPLAGSLAFSADGRQFAVGSYVNGRVAVYNRGDPAEPVAEIQLDRYGGYLMALAIAGNRLAVAGLGGVELYDIAEPGRPRRLDLPLGPDTLTGTVAFDATGTKLAAPGSLDVVRIWDLNDPDRPRLDVDLHRGLTHWKRTMIAFADHGQVLAESAADGTLRRWHIDADAIARDICASGTAPITEQEWARVLPGRPFVSTCPA